MTSTKSFRIRKFKDNAIQTKEDQLAVEEPLEIRILSNGETKPISITMRTPGQDAALAVGFLFTEGIIKSRAQITDVQHIKHWNPEMQNNVIQVSFAENVDLDLGQLERHFYTSSSCGVCGKASIDAIRATGLTQVSNQDFNYDKKLIYELPKKLRSAQAVFESTGGLHAAALFDQGGELKLLCEDVGRHNALDKLIGTAFLNQNITLSEHLLLLSGRVSFELVQKAAMANIPMIAAIGAPSSLAIELAKEMGITVIGFIKKGSFNIYCDPQTKKA